MLAVSFAAALRGNCLSVQELTHFLLQFEVLVNRYREVSIYPLTPPAFFRELFRVGRLVWPAFVPARQYLQLLHSQNTYSQLAAGRIAEQSATGIKLGWKQTTGPCHLYIMGRAI